MSGIYRTRTGGHGPIEIKTGGYVEAADFVRAVTVVAMIGVHSTWYMANGGNWVSSGAILAVLHFTRESFMALTGFVLTYSLAGKTIRWAPMLWRRYRLVLFPYLIWTAAYMAAFKNFGSLGIFSVHYGINLLDGGGWFHLYYLLVTMQFYAILPLFLALMRVARRFAWVVLSLAVVLQLALMTYDQYGIGPHPSGINAHVGEEVWTYLAYFVWGGVAALNWDAVRRWLHDHLLLVTILGVGTVSLMLLQFVLQMHAGPYLARADSVVQPAMVPWAITAIVLLAALGIRYEDARQRNPGRWPMVKWAADLSFGLYLIHPMILQYWTNLLSSVHRDTPSFWLDTLTWAMLVVGSGIAAKLISWTPASQWIIGRTAIPPGAGKALNPRSSSGYRASRWGWRRAKSRRRT